MVEVNEVLKDGISLVEMLYDLKATSKSFDQIIYSKDTLRRILDKIKENETQVARFLEKYPNSEDVKEYAHYILGECKDIAEHC